jgi:hypothetical protein
MTSTDLWTENELLRERLRDVKLRLEHEREERLKLKAENLWIKKLLEEQLQAAGAQARGSVTRIF